MADETKQATDATAEAVKATTAAVTETAKDAASATAKASKRVTDAAEKTAKKSAKTTAGKTNRKAKAQRRTRRAQPTAKPTAAKKRNDTMNTNSFFAPFGAIPATPFQSLFAEAGERGQEAVGRSQKAAEELADLTRANVEAIVDAGRIAAEGFRSIGQSAVESGREGVEQTAGAVRSLAEAKSPTEFVQLQTELARTSFDRLVAESSRLTESMVKVAGEAFQPLSTRASLNAERINKLVA